LLRRAYSEGHTIGTHTQHHPLNIPRLPALEAEKEIADGIHSVCDTLGPNCAVAPFFRFPGLLRTLEAERYLTSCGVAIWSADFLLDDWLRISDDEIVTRAVRRLSILRKGIVLLHDIQPRTVRALPKLLNELRRREYRVVHVVPKATCPTDHN